MLVICILKGTSFALFVQAANFTTFSEGDTVTIGKASRAEGVPILIYLVILLFKKEWVQFCIHDAFLRICELYTLLRGCVAS